VWTDGFFPKGLAIAAGWVDSSLLGAYDAADNNGFARNLSGLPSTDQARMITFFEGELARRGFERADFADTIPIPEIFYAQKIFEPAPCENGEGVSRTGTVTWSGGPARYVHILEPGSANPGAPPNLDTPEGTVWMVDVPWSEDAFTSGISYGETSGALNQRVPDGAAPALVEGATYTLYVQKDINNPLSRCTFTY
jgi:hypothetical protein